MSSITMNDPGPIVVPESVRVEHDEAGLSPSLAVVEAIADLAGVESIDLADEAGIVLYDYIDPDALDALVAGAHDTELDLSVTIAGYDVRIDESAVVARRSAE